MEMVYDHYLQAQEYVCCYIKCLWLRGGAISRSLSCESYSQLFHEEDNGGKL